MSSANTMRLLCCLRLTAVKGTLGWLKLGKWSLNLTFFGGEHSMSILRLDDGVVVVLVKWSLSLSLCAGVRYTEVVVCLVQQRSPF